MKLLLFLFISNTALADVKYLQQGEVSPFTGYLFSLDKEKDVRLLDQKLENCVSKTEVLLSIVDMKDKIVTLSNSRVETFQKENEELNKKLQDNSSGAFWKNTLYFFGGALLSGVIAYGVATSIR